MNRSGLKALIDWVLPAAGTSLLAAYIVFPEFQELILSTLYPGAGQYVHSRLSLARMSMSHALVSLGATLAAGTSGMILGFVVTHGRGSYFSGIIKAFNSVAQTIPPAAVVILAFPVLGFGWPPTLLALILYSIFPVVTNTMAGFFSIPPEVINAASGMGMNRYQRLAMVELPLAAPMILAGLRHSFILNIGTATIGALIGGGGLGTIIISGLTLRNPALVLSGTIAITGMVLLVDHQFELVSRRFLLK